MKTLIVEDDMMSQCLLAKELAERGYEVVSYENAEQAILAYQKQFYPLLFVDVGLPGMGGLQFCKWVRAQPNGDKVFIMVATSSGQPDDLGEVLKVGANDFLPKPYDVGALAVRLTVAETQMKEFFARKELEDKLRASQESFQRVLAAAGEGVWLLNAQFRTDYVNPQMGAMIGCALTELEGRAVLDFLPETARGDAEQLFAQQRDGEEVKREIRFRRKDGSECPAYLSAAPIRAAGGEFQGALWMVTDLSGRKSLETELADTRKKLEAQARDLTGELNKTARSLQTESGERKKIEQTFQQARADWEARSREQAAERAKAADELKAEIAGRQKLEAQLARARDELAARVREFTVDLNKAKDALQGEIHRRKEDEETLRKLRKELDARLQQEKDEVAKVARELKTEQTARKQAEEALQKARAEAELRAKQHGEELAQRLKEHGAELLKVSQDSKTHLAERKRVEEELLQNRAELARRVKEHMAEMVKAGDELKAVLAERKKTEESLGQARAEAELKVNDRTNELAHVREQLKAETAERRQLEEKLAKDRQEREARLQELAGLKEELKQRAERLARTGEDLQAETAARSRAEEALQQTRQELETRLSDLSGRLDRAQQELNERAAQVGRANEELQARTGALARANQELKSEMAAHRRAGKRAAAFLKLGRELSAARTPNDVARVVAGLAQELVGWDACSFDLYSADENRISPVLNIDTVNGRPAEVPPTYAGPDPGPIMRNVIRDGAQLVLRPGPSHSHTDFVLFGDRARLAASLMCVALRQGNIVAGFLSVHRYTPDAYDQEDLDTLQALADYGAGALERMRAEETQRQGQARPGTVLETAPDAAVTMDQEGNVTEWNPAAEQMFGRRRADVLGKELAGLIVPPAFRDRHRAGLRRTLAGGEGSGAMLGKPVELKALRADGTEFPVEMTVTRVAAEGPPLFNGLIRDLTGRADHEAKLRQAQKMELIGQLAAGVAHDFNNLLSVVQGYSTLLREETNVKPETAEALKEIVSATERAAHLTRQLLAFSRKQIVHLRNIDLNELVNSVGKLLRRAIGETTALQVNYSPGLPAVEADAGMIEQVVMNLAINARDAMPQGGQLTIATKTAEIDEAYVRSHPQARGGRFVCLTVSDTGCGMDAATRERIFEPFFTTKPAGKGTGLGLATVYGIVNQHQGWIDVQSRVGQGTTFEIFLPISSQAVVAPSPTGNHPAVPGGTETILLVEDEPAVLHMAKGILQRLGYQVLTAACGDEAVPIWRQNAARINLLLTDMVMPGNLNGRELAEKLLQERPDLNVLYTSGYSLDLIGPGLATSKNFVFLQKPYHPDVLGQTVRHCLDQGAASTHGNPSAGG